jgi:predicted amidophosphoribosyltransferase
VNTGNFCGNCGEKKPADGKWICPKCGAENAGNFCSTCGEKKPA